MPGLHERPVDGVPRWPRRFDAEACVRCVRCVRASAAFEINELALTQGRIVASVAGWVASALAITVVSSGSRGAQARAKHCRTSYHDTGRVGRPASRTGSRLQPRPRAIECTRSGAEATRFREGWRPWWCPEVRAELPRTSYHDTGRAGRLVSRSGSRLQP